MEKKNDYISPEVEIILLELSDIITESQTTNPPEPDIGDGGYGSDDTGGWW